ncbi:MAG TPA: immune inhibitor A domain-containing protein [Thermoanaerobaculia bacterium]|nr:immune inhibitor A domain-containing protein [Thermoanaerobaculia bacterium]
MVLAAALLAAVPLTAQDLEPTAEVEQSGERLSLIEDEEGVRLAGSDYFPAPQSEERDALRREAVEQRLANKAAHTGRTHQVAKGQYLEFPVDRTDRIFVLLVEYGNGVAKLPDGTSLSAAAGPLHNQIPQPDRSVNNTTIWQADYSPEHYKDMYFRQMVDYYKSQSSGRYTFNGDVTHWVKVPFNGYRYGANNSSISDVGTWTLIADGINLWVNAQIASGQTLEQVKAYLRTFDAWDRYDYDKDGNFDESDGYIDHFQIVHAGDGEETGGGTLGSAAIWSHRWFAFYNYRGPTGLGPAYNKFGGLEFGGGFGANPTGQTVTSYGTIGSTRSTVTNAHTANPTGIWVGDYTIQPENGGLGVFAHEYGHDLGLPDHYDTAGGDNSTGYWTIMSSGSYLGPGHTDVGSRPGDMSAWDKLQLGWLNYELASVAAYSNHKLGPAENTTKKAQAVVIPLPPEQNFLYEFDSVSVAAANGKFWFSGTGNNWDATMTRQIDVPATGATLSMRLWYSLEANWDYGYVSVSTNGVDWTNLASANLTTTTNPNLKNLGNGFTGNSGGWVTRSFNLAPYAGQSVQLRVRYVTDAFTFLPGVAVDDITVGSFADTADSTAGWTLTKFHSSSGKRISNKPHYYIAEFRQYRGYDTGLQTGPYSGSLLGMPRWYAHYPYQDGLLITYADSDWTNNNTSVHRGEGFALPIDARPAVMTRTGLLETATGLRWNITPWSSRVQSFDSTFGLEPTDALTLSFTIGLPAGSGYPARQAQFDVPVPSQPAEPFFTDLKSYWSPAKPDASVIIPQTGVRIRVENTSAQGSFMLIHVNE